MERIISTLFLKQGKRGNVRRLKVKVKVLVTQPRPTLCDPRDCSPPGSSVHGVLQARTLEWVAMPFSRDLPNPGIESRWIFLTQGLNPGLLHCRQILYHWATREARVPCAILGFSLKRGQLVLIWLSSSSTLDVEDILCLSPFNTN